MLTSPKGLALIKDLTPCTLTSRLNFQARTSRWIVGYNHTRNAKPRQTITQDQAEVWLLDDILAIETGLDEALPEVVLNQNQLDAIVSLVFSSDLHAFRKSNIRQYLLMGNFDKAVECFDKWIYAGGRKLHSLRNRRNKEKALFLA